MVFALMFFVFYYFYFGLEEENSKYSNESFKALCKSKELDPSYFKIFNLGQNKYK